MLAPEMVRLVAAVATSMVLVVPAVRTKLRLVEAVLPVYCRVPPPRVRLAAVVEAAPRLLAVPPLLMVPMLRTPAVMVVAPV